MPGHVRADGNELLRVRLCRCCVAEPGHSLLCAAAAPQILDVQQEPKSAKLSGALLEALLSRHISHPCIVQTYDYAIKPLVGAALHCTSLHCADICLYYQAAAGAVHAVLLL